VHLPRYRGLAGGVETDAFAQGTNQAEAVGTLRSGLVLELKSQPGSVPLYALQHRHVHLRDSKTLAAGTFCIEETGKEAAHVALTR
jgi:hypothetical protein